MPKLPRETPEPPQDPTPTELARDAVLEDIEYADNLFDQAASLAVHYLAANWSDAINDDPLGVDFTPATIVKDLKETIAILSELVEVAAEYVKAAPSTEPELVWELTPGAPLGDVRRRQAAPSEELNGGLRQFDMYDELRILVRKADIAAIGDSNDAHIAALSDALSAALAMLPDSIPSETTLVALLRDENSIACDLAAELVEKHDRGLIDLSTWESVDPFLNEVMEAHEIPEEYR